MACQSHTVDFVWIHPFSAVFVWKMGALFMNVGIRFPLVKHHFVPAFGIVCMIDPY